MDRRPPHHRQGAVLAAVAARVHRPPAVNAAEAGILATLMDALLDRLGQMAEQIPQLDNLTPEAIAATLVLIDDIAEHVTESLAKAQTTIWAIAQIVNEGEE